MESLTQAILRRVTQLSQRERHPQNAWADSTQVQASLTELAHILAEWEQQQLKHTQTQLEKTTKPIN